MDCESNNFSNVISEENRVVYDAIKEFCMTVAENVGQMVPKTLVFGNWLAVFNIIN